MNLSRTSRNQSVGRAMPDMVGIAHPTDATSPVSDSPCKAAPMLDLRYILVTNCDGLTNKRLNNAVGAECHMHTRYCIALVGANSFAHNLLFVRMNSHLHTTQLRFLGSWRLAQVGCI